MWNAGEGMGWWMAFGGGLWLLFWVLMVVLVVQLVRHWSKADDDGHDAVAVVRRRYAAGEITKQQFEEMRRDLTG